MTTPAPCPPSHEESVLDPHLLISLRIHAALANRSVLILHRRQWQCLANSHSEVFRVLAHLLQHDCNPPLDPSKIDPPLHALLRSMQESERCIEECTASCPSSSHSWLLGKALKLGVSSDVVNVHLQDFLWAFAAVIDQAIALQIISLKPDLVQITRRLSEIWAEHDAKADLSEACSFLKTIKTKEEELEDALHLVRDFTLEELRHATASFSKVLGEGGTGKVYYGKLEDGREIAVKAAIRPELLRSGRIGLSSKGKGLVQELKIASQLRHRNIVSLIGWCKDQGKLLLV